MAIATSGGGSRKKPSVGQQRTLRDIKKAQARKQLTSVKGVAGVVGGAILEGIGGPKARGAKAVVSTGSKIIRKVSAVEARRIAEQAAGRAAKAPFGRPRSVKASAMKIRTVAPETPKKTTVRQQVGPKTKSGKFTEPKSKVKTNTQPPVGKKPTPKPKTDINSIRYSRNLPANTRLANVERARRAKMIEEYKAERTRQAKLAASRQGKNDTTTKTNFGIYSKSGTKYTVNVPKSSKINIESRPSQTTIESRLASGAEKLDITSRNASKAPQIDSAEWRKYAQLLRESVASKPNVSPAQIAGGRARALQTDSVRRSTILKATRDKAIAKAKAKGMTDAQISTMISNARKEAASIARKAKG